ncbi:MULTISPECIES: FtsX-like permease family protein [Pseudanabaena]|jgi:putative ABC transport system permease protein|uniref:FtsX-like permease family protein n=1 Tax=Pseudanabaena TaxID=1152 RepID=UPI002478D8B1|nr:MULTISPECIES: FtsX-like permease family protein [Pseudanabaena]MEA5489261.1 FtsX-like permease family protein [Pseudanabaena sp. CCNP1317]WGS73488.1 peptide ABC transporter permease [Pseudanabaena galeata CCNP1313]
MIFAVPLAWLQLTYEKSRLLVAIAGITFAVVLMFLQLGFRDALFTSAIRLQSNLVGDLVIISPQSTNLVGMRNFSQRRLYQALGMKEVASVNPVYIGLGAWKIKEDPAGQTRNILVLGANPDAKVFKMSGAEANIDQVKTQDVVLFDRASRAEFGPIVGECGTLALKAKFTDDAFVCNNLVTREVANRKLTIGGLFELGASFAADGAVITSDTNFLRIFDSRRSGLINVGLINLKPDASPYEAMRNFILSQPSDHVILPREKLQPDGKRVQILYKESIDANGKLIREENKDKVFVYKTDLTVEDLKKTQDAAVDDTRILTMEGYIDFEKGYWQKSTAIGFIFSLGTVMGFIVGIVIVYQILYTDVSDHLAEYATLKAMGYGNLYLAQVVIQEAFVLSILGFIPGLGISFGLYNLTKNATLLPLYIWDKAIPVMLLTMVMCVISGAISLRKVQSADPAEIFG